MPFSLVRLGRRIRGILCNRQKIYTMKTTELFAYPGTHCKLASNAKCVRADCEETTTRNMRISPDLEAKNFPEYATTAFSIFDDWRQREFRDEEFREFSSSEVFDG